MIDTKKKINNHDYVYKNTTTIEEKYRDIIGNIIDQENLIECINLINNKSANNEKMINNFINEVFY